MNQKLRRIKELYEYEILKGGHKNSMKLVKNFDMCFPGLLWQADVPNFEPTVPMIRGLFDAVNDGMFENKIDRKSIDFRLETAAKGVDAAAGFCGGEVEGRQKALVIFSTPGKKVNFFHFSCQLIHEMIHAYDFQCGPISELMKKHGVIGGLNWGKAYGSAEQLLKHARLTPDQLPDDMPTDDWPRQYNFPAFKLKDPSRRDEFVELYKKLTDLVPKYNKKVKEFYDARNDGFTLIANTLYPSVKAMDDRLKDIEAKMVSIADNKVGKYSLAPGSMYDVHGFFFKRQAKIANDQGFDVDDVWITDRPHRMRRMDEDPDEDPIKLRAGVDDNIARRMYDSLKSDNLIAYKYFDDKNWFIEIE